MWFASKKSTVTREQQLAAKPLRTPDARKEDRPDGSGAVVKLPLRGGRIFRAPAGTSKSFELDEIGLFVWERCDGQTTLEQLIHALAERYRINLREAEVATMKFLETLSRKGLIALKE
jgi:hypothetical protein